MVGMAMGDDDEVDVLTLQAGLIQLDREPSGIRAAARAIAAVEDDNLLARVYDDRRKGRLDLCVRQKVLDRPCLDRLGRLVLSEGRVRPIRLNGAVEDRGDLELPQLRPVDRGALDGKLGRGRECRSC